MPRCTFKTFLMKKTDTTYEKLVDIKDYPDLGGAPEMLDTTTLSDPSTTSIPGIQQLDALTFNLNYSLEDYEKLSALKDEENEYAVFFGGIEGADGKITPTGDEGKFGFKGRLSVHITGAGVNEVTGMVATIAPSSAIVPITTT